MAEKPRLKKSNEILGSITAEPSRAKRAGGRASDNNGEQNRREQSAKAKSDDNGFYEDDIELSDGPELPSAQSLAEKLLPKKPPKQVAFSFEPVETPKPAPKPAPEPVTPVKAEQPVVRPTPAPRPAASAPTAPVQPAAAPPRPKVEFADAPAANDKRSANLEFEAAPAAAKPVAIEFGAEEAFAAPVPDTAPARRQPASRAARPAPEPEPAPTISEYTFQTFEEPKAVKNVPPVWEFSAQEADNTQPERARRKPEESRENQPQQQPQREQQPKRERIIQPMRTETPAAYEPEPEQPAFSFEPPEPPVQAPPPMQTPRREPAPPPMPAPPPPEPEIPEAERSRQEFLKRIASQFEVQFEEKFEDGVRRPRENLLPSEPPRSERPVPRRETLFAAEPQPQPRPIAQNPVPLDDQIEGEDFLAYVQRQERERRQKMGGASSSQASRPTVPEPENERAQDEPALGFIEKFEKDIREEEHQRSEDFKETLSQKFMRERERYLKELDIEDDEPESPILMPEQESVMPPAAPARRKLDFQIQPEMHMQAGDAPPARRAGAPAVKPPISPVTYNRGGAARPQNDDVDAPVPRPMPPAPPAPPAQGSKKTSEQLLLELGARARTPAPSGMPKPQPAKLKFTFETPEEREQKVKGEKESILPTEKWPRRIILIAMAAGLFALGLVVWSMVSYYNLSSGLSNGLETSAPESQPAVEDTLTVYNDRVNTQTLTANSVLFKNAGTLLKNVHVQDYVVIENVEGTGRIRLEDAKVDSAISVKSSGSDVLELHNVKTPRLIVNNPQADMKINITGNSDIDIVELRTKSSVIQSDMGSDSAGVVGMIVNASETGGEIDVKLDGLSLRNLETNAGAAILAFANNTRAETLSADGSLSLTGDGKISSLSIGSKVGQGAGDFDDRKDVTLFVKDVTISSLNVKSPANLTLYTAVDSISTSDTISLGGEASVGTLTLNPKAGSSSRLLIDIVSANVQSVYSNTPSRINVTDSARINELTADASTYTLGNKVNHLRVNADGVIYESEPDKITIANGIRPPQTKADNPNLDYSLGTAQQSVTDTTGEDFATTCGHSRENGGFILGDGSRDAPYEVSTAMQLAHVASHLASHFAQTTDIDVSAEGNLASNFPSIGTATEPFEGVFDGKGYAIARLKIVSQSEYTGLFGVSRGVIQNVRIYSGEISASPLSLGFAGSIAGLVYDGGQIRSCANGASVTGNQYTRTGGIAGVNNGGRVHDCYNYANITGFDTVGGIVGLNRQGASVTGSYNAGFVDGNDSIGSIVGSNEDGMIANCYYLTDSSGYGIGSGYGTATEKTDEELSSTQMAADLSAGNESSLWTPSSASGSYRYPVHRKPE